MASAVRAPLAFLYPAGCRPLLRPATMHKATALRQAGGLGLVLPHTIAAAARRKSSGGLKRGIPEARMRKMMDGRFDKMSAGRLKDMPSMRVAAAEQMTKAGVNDFGLLPETFVMPTGANKPSLAAWPVARLKLEWHRAQLRAKDYGRLVFVKWFAGLKPRPKLRTGQVPKIAMALHRNMYTAFADADEAALSEICCNGLRDKFLNQVQSRGGGGGRGEGMSWVLHRYNGRARIVSHKASAIPLPGSMVGKTVVLRQAVVRIASSQSLEEAEPRDLVEYVVVQQLLGLGEEAARWRVWGTINEEKDGWKKFI